MPGVNAGKQRENLFMEISNTLREWPELERKVFFQAHYDGRSVETISRSLELNVEQVNSILGQCDRRLHASLRNFRKNDGDSSLPVPAKPAFPADCVPEQPHAPAFDISEILDNIRLSA